MRLRRSRTIRAGIGLCLGLGWACLAGGPALAAPGGIEWRSDLRSAQSEAWAQGRPLWIQFTGPWCHNCHRMERESFTHPKVIDRAGSAFIPVLLQSDAHEELALQYGELLAQLGFGGQFLAGPVAARSDVAF